MWLVATERFQCRQECLGAIEILPLVSGEIDLTQKLYGGGYDGLLIIYFKTREVCSVFYKNVGSAFEVAQQ